MDDDPTRRPISNGRARSAASPHGPLRLRVAIACGGSMLCASLAATLLRPPLPWLLWNASPSSPVGLYAILSAARLKPGDIAIAWPPPEARRLAARRHYLPLNVPLVKRIAATSGARVCATGNRITLNGHGVALRRPSDPSGRRLPWWSGCTRLNAGQVFLLSTASGAFDGRYFGVTRPCEILGSGKLLWRR